MKTNIYEKAYSKCTNAKQVLRVHYQFLDDFHSKNIGDEDRKLEYEAWNNAMAKMDTIEIQLGLKGIMAEY